MSTTCLPNALRQQLAAYQEANHEPRFQTRHYSEVTLGNGDEATVQASVGKYNCKGEDRFVLWTKNNSDKDGINSEEKNKGANALFCHGPS